MLRQTQDTSHGATSHRNIPVVHIPHGVGDLEHDVGSVLLALEVVRGQQVATFAQVLM